MLFRRQLCRHAIGGHASLRGFTLIELLVVIAIIALLASFLTSGIGATRIAARKLTCQKQLGQLLVGVLAYANEWEGRVMPVSDWNGTDYGPSSIGQTWGEVLAVHLDQRVSGEPLSPGARQLGAFRCPENSKQRYQMTHLSGAPNDQISYGGNGWYEQTVSGWDGAFFGNPLGRTEHAGELLALTECSYFRISPFLDDGVGTKPYLPVGVQFVRYAHNAAANGVYADGHVGSFRLLSGNGLATGIASFRPYRALSYTNGSLWYATQ